MELSRKLEIESITAELQTVNRALAIQQEENGKLSAELGATNEELVFQDLQKARFAAELIIANRKLALQNEEKDQRAAELIVANKELAFQNQEKENRAAELAIANKELVFQNEEKGKRAAELAIANKELVIQNEEKEKQAGELAGANKDLEAFSYSISHDLRAPLRGLSGYAQMLQEDYGPQFDENGNRMLKLIRDSAELMGRLIDDLLMFSKLGRKEIQKADINMTPLAEVMIDEIRIHTPGVEIHVHPLHNAWADRALIKQVLFNYVSNAVKYSSKKDRPCIEIESAQSRNEIIYSVKDNGAGFEMTYAHKLFKVFQRLHTAEEFEGTGVGLAIAARIINKHGGRTWAEGKLEKGATFYFSLPVRPEHTENN